MSANLEQVTEYFERRDQQGFSDLGGTAQIAKDLLDTDPERGLQVGEAASRLPKNKYTDDQKKHFPSFSDVETSDYLVVRGEGDNIVVKGCDLVRGDVVFIRVGETIPCDMLILNGLFMCLEGDITGESDPVPKASTTDCCLSGGTTLVEGGGYCVVLNVGPESYMAKTYDAMKRYDEGDE